MSKCREEVLDLKMLQEIAETFGFFRFTSTEFILLPFNISGDHWTLLLFSHLRSLYFRYDSGTPCLYVLDSFQSDNVIRDTSKPSKTPQVCEVYNGLLRFLELRFVWELGLKQPMQITDLPVIDVAVPKQQHLHECGVYTLNYIRHFYLSTLKGDVTNYFRSTTSWSSFFRTNPSLTTFGNEEVILLRKELALFCRGLSSLYEKNISIFRYNGMVNRSSVCFANSIFQLLFGYSEMFLYIDIDLRQSIAGDDISLLNKTLLNVYCEILELFHRTASTFIENDIDIKELYVPKQKSMRTRNAEPSSAPPATLGDINPFVTSLRSYCKELAKCTRTSTCTLINRMDNLFGRTRKQQSAAEFLSLLADLGIFPKGTYVRRYHYKCTHDDCLGISHTDAVEPLPLLELYVGDLPSDGEATKSIQELINSYSKIEQVDRNCQWCSCKTAWKHVVVHSW